MTDATKGVIAITLACLIWGLAPLYYKLLSNVPALELVSHRTVWSFVFFLGVLAIQGRARAIFTALNTKKNVITLIFAAVTIAMNWFFFIYSIQIGKATEASLGYYIYPLVTVVFGVILFGERLSLVQIIAVALAAVAVLVLSLGLGVAPWIALILSTSFGLYSVMKKRLDVPPMVSVTVEVGFLLPIAGSVIAWWGSDGHFLADWKTAALLMFSGPLTATPLILFSYAAKRVRLATVGLVQYLNPTMQFACAVFIFREPFGQWHMIAFGLIWAALTIYSYSALRAENASRKARAASAAVSQ